MTKIKTNRRINHNLNGKKKVAAVSVSSSDKSDNFKNKKTKIKTVIMPTIHITIMIKKSSMDD